MAKKKPQQIQGTLFEEDYLVRTLGSIARSSDVALTELVANAWDAGASEVRITIPDEHDQEMLVLDDGCGMTAEQFKTRWMTLGYNRTKHQGRGAEFPPERSNGQRMAFGQNGLGRHALLCFADKYEVETHRDGEGNRFVVATSSGDEPFILTSETKTRPSGHGTRLSTRVQRNLPSADGIRNVLSARFLHDPTFKVYVNERDVPLHDLPGLVDSSKVKINDRLSIELVFIDSIKAARTTEHQGVAFWVGGRLVGQPSWVLGSRVLIDGRTHFAKRYTLVVKTKDLIEVVLPDWSAFGPSHDVELVYDEVEKYVRMMFQKVSTERIQETKETVLREHIEDISELPPLARHEVAEFVEELATQQPTILAETISGAVQAMINLEKSHSGTSLLKKLAGLSDEDIEGLDRLLGEWTIRDALTVLDAIDRRIAAIEAIKKLSGDHKTDELHTLHPLVSQSRWLFGPGFESEEFASNISLQNAVKKVFSDRIVEHPTFINPRKRPDLVVLKDASLSAVGLERFDPLGTLVTLQQVLLIEMKRGDSSIGRAEMTQASYYVQDILKCGFLDGAPNIQAFVVGHRLDDKIEPVQKIGDPEKGVLTAITYGQLVRTGEARLFRLRDRLHDRYEEVKGTDLLSRVLAEPRQLTLKSEIVHGSEQPIGSGQPSAST